MSTSSKNYFFLLGPKKPSWLSNRTTIYYRNCIQWLKWKSMRWSF